MALGVAPTQQHQAPLARRMAFLTGARLALLALLLALVSVLYPRIKLDADSMTFQLALGTLAVAFGLSGVYAFLLKKGWRLGLVSDVQVVLDQLAWTVFVYLSGGASSGASSFYGLTCVVGAILTGVRGAAIAALTGGVLYTTVAVGLHAGWLPIPSDQTAAAYQLQGAELKYYIFVNLVALLVVTLLAGYLAERLRITGGRLAAAEVRAEQAERLAVLGRLATGLAHEIRNPLGSIAGAIQLLRASKSLDDEDRQLCSIVYREARRLEDLVSDMMGLARPTVPVCVPSDIANLCREIVALAASSGRGGGDVPVVYQGPDSLWTLGDANQLRQLTWNLVRNAVQASSAGDEVTIRLGVVGGQLELEVADCGAGILPEDRERIFDAFFTTRSQGTGIGLAVVKRIVDQHGFSVQVGSGSDGGAAFRVRMPLVAPPRDQRR
jgi:two-component system sensor histidine kinase HydH